MRRYPSYPALKRDKLHHHWAGDAPSFTLAGLTAYWDTTGQTGAESLIPDIVGGLDAVHSATKPTWNAARRLWTYPGVHAVQSNTAPSAALGTAGVWTMECVYALTNASPSSGHVAGIVAGGIAAGCILQHNATPTRQAVCRNNTPGNTSVGAGIATVGTLYHVFVVSDGATFAVYVNNVLAGGPTAGVGATQASVQVGFGDRPAANAPAACDAGWMRYYAAKALNAAERAQNYAHAKSLFSELP